LAFSIDTGEPWGSNQARKGDRFLFFSAGLERKDMSLEGVIEDSVENHADSRALRRIDKKL
jgi:hypothetical protein